MLFIPRVGRVKRRRSTTILFVHAVTSLPGIRVRLGSDCGDGCRGVVSIGVGASPSARIWVRWWVALSVGNGASLL